MMRGVSNYRTGNITLYYKDDDYKYKLSGVFSTKLVRLRRKLRGVKGGVREHFDLTFVNLYRALGGKLGDGTFSSSPGTEFFMAMFDPCVTAFFADSSASMNISFLAETVSQTDVVVESFETDRDSESVRFCKYHFKFQLAAGLDDDLSE